MEFAHDTVSGLDAAVALVNLDPARELSTAQQVADFYQTHEFSGRIDGSSAEITELVSLRPRLRQLLLAERDAKVEQINSVLKSAGALPQLVRHGDWDWHVHAVSAEAALATRIEVECALALIDLLRADELSRLGVCAQPDCEGVVLDLTRNRSRRFCSATCGNRAAVAAYRARKASSAS